MKKIISILLAFVALLAIGCSEETKEPRFTEPNTIKMEDLNIGGIYWDQPMSEVITKLGNPVKKRQGAPRGTWYTFLRNNGEIGVFSSSSKSDTSGEVMKMYIKGDTGFTTSKGIKIGSSYYELVKIYGTPTIPKGKGYRVSYRYRSSRNPKQPDSYRYLDFELDQNDRIISISFGFFDDSC